MVIIDRNLSERHSRDSFSLATPFPRIIKRLKSFGAVVFFFFIVAGEILIEFGGWKLIGRGHFGVNGIAAGTFFFITESV